MIKPVSNNARIEVELVKAQFELFKGKSISHFTEQDFEDCKLRFNNAIFLYIKNLKK